MSRAHHNLAVARDRTLVFAHRGGSALMPENTLTAFDHGLSLGADGLEIDVRLSRDGVVMVHHDTTLERTTNGRGAIEVRSAVELNALDAAYTFAPDRGYPMRDRGVRIPRLAEVLARYPGVPLIVELKGGDIRLPLAAVEEASRASALDRVCFGAYSRQVLQAVRRAHADAVTSAAREEVRLAVYKTRVGWPIGRPPYCAFQIPERAGTTTVVSPRFVRAAHRAAVAVQVWTVDDPADIERLLGWGVDGIITDRPDVAVEVVRGFAAEARSRGD